MSPTPTTDHSHPDRFSVSINGFNLFQNIPPLEIRRNTFLVGPNGSGKSTFLRLLPLFALPEKVHLPSLADKGFSIGHFLFSDREQKDQDEASENGENTLMHNLDDSPFQRGRKVEVIVQYVLSRHHWIAPPTELIAALRESERTSAKTDVAARNSIERLLHQIDRDSTYLADSEDDHEGIPVRIHTSYVGGPQWLVKTYTCIEVLVGGSWAAIHTEEDGVSVRLLREFEAFGALCDLLDSGADANGEIGRWVDWSLAGLYEEWFSPLEVALEKALKDALGHDNVSVSLSGKHLLQWVKSFFLISPHRFFRDSRLSNLSRIDSGPLFAYERGDIGTIVHQFREDEVHSNLVTYWLKKAGFGDGLRVEDLNGDGWRLLVNKGRVWENVSNLGGGLARFAFLLFALSRVRTASVPSPGHESAKAILSVSPHYLEVKRDPNELQMMLRAAGPTLLEQPGVLVLEEPENRLHPRLQSFLADIVCNVWNENSPAANAVVADVRSHIHKPAFRKDTPEQLRRQVKESYRQCMADLPRPYCGERYLVNAIIVETHSEYLIRRLQSLVARRQVDPSDVIIHYFSDPHTERAEDTETSWPIEINPDGTLTRDFGPGFFGEAASLIDDLWQAWKPES